MDKAKASYDLAYSLINSNLFTYYSGILAMQGKIRNSQYVIANYESIERLEELRFVWLSLKISFKW